MAVLLEDKYAIEFADELRRDNIPATVVQGESTHRASGHLIRVTVAVENVADWEVRYAVLDVARRVEDAFEISVICSFRQE